MTYNRYKLYITLLQLPRPRPLMPLPDLALSCPPAARVGTTAVPLRQRAPASRIWSGQRESKDMSMVAVHFSRLQLETPVGFYRCTDTGNRLKIRYIHVLSSFSHQGL